MRNGWRLEQQILSLIWSTLSCSIPSPPGSRMTRKSTPCQTLPCFSLWHLSVLVRSARGQTIGNLWDLVHLPQEGVPLKIILPPRCYGQAQDLRDRA